MTKEEEIKHVFKNREIIIAKKKNVIKHSDIVLNCDVNESTETTVNKSGVVITADNPNPNKLIAKLVINTTNLIDSHMDCHIGGIWKNSLNQNKVLYLLQEHEMEFDKIISDSVNDNLKVTVQTLPWSKLGYSFDGKTEALIFEASISKERNEFMFNQYAKGYVLNHSVGMRYIKMHLCIDSDEAMYANEKASWEKYYPMVVNKEVADKKGYFWAVTEASVIEGSAVVKGSNEYTPVMEIEIEKTEAVNDTSNPEPLENTQKRKANYLLI